MNILLGVISMKMVDGHTIEMPSVYTSKVYVTIVPGTIIKTTSRYYSKDYADKQANPMPKKEPTQKVVCI